MRRRFIFFLLLYVVLNGFVGGHGAFLLRFAGLGALTGIYGFVFTLVAFSYLISHSRRLPRWLGRCFKLIGSYYFAVFEFGAILLFAADIAAAILSLFGVGMNVIVPVLGTCVLIALVVLFARGSYNAWTPVTRTYEIEIDKPAGELQELRVGVASDIHLSDIVGNRHLRRLVSGLNALRPDLILLVGDVIDNDIEPFVRKRMADELKGLRARFGTFAVLGNHEYYGGHIEEFVRRMAEIGIPVLQDEAVDIGGSFTVVGRKDKAAESMDPAGRRPVEELLAEADAARPIILMDHQPYHLDKAEAAGADVMLSGHTHRGQFAPNHLFTRRLFELDWGYKRKGRMHAVVSSGFGTWGPPIRLASRSEIVELIIRFRSK